MVMFTVERGSIGSLPVSLFRLPRFLGLAERNVPETSPLERKLQKSFKASPGVDGYRPGWRDRNQSKWLKRAHSPCNVEHALIPRVSFKVCKGPSITGPLTVRLPGFVPAFGWDNSSTVKAPGERACGPKAGKAGGWRCLNSTRITSIQDSIFPMPLWLKLQSHISVNLRWSTSLPSSIREFSHLLPVSSRVKPPEAHLFPELCQGLPFPFP